MERRKKGRPTKETEKVHPAFSKAQLELIRSFKGVLGEDDTEIVKSIVVNWLMERQEIQIKKRQ